jgi:hypothetical protein
MGKIHVGGAEGADELIFECLDSPFSGVDTVIAGFDKLEATLLWGKVQFDCFCCLIVHDVDFWGVPFARKKFKVLLYASRILCESRPGMGVANMAFVCSGTSQKNICCHQAT